MNAITQMPLVKSERTIQFDDGDETISVRLTEYFNDRYRAVDRDRSDLAEGFGDTQMSAIADLFEKLPRAASEREERDELAARFDHQRDMRKHSEAV